MLDSGQRSRLLNDNRARFGIAVIVIMTLAAIAAPVISTQDPLKIDLSHLLQRPSAAHWLGTDLQGRDVWSRLVFGSRVSLTVGLISQGIALALGVTFGLLAGYYGKWVDEVVMRLADVTLAFPTLLLLIAMVAAFQPSMGVVFATIGSAGRGSRDWSEVRCSSSGSSSTCRRFARSVRETAGSCSSTCCRTSSRLL